MTEQESDLTARYEIPAGQTVTVTADEATTVEFYNALLRGKITGHKTGAEQAPLEGVSLRALSLQKPQSSPQRNRPGHLPPPTNPGEFTFEAPYQRLPGEGAGSCSRLRHHEGNHRSGSEQNRRGSGGHRKLPNGGPLQQGGCRRRAKNFPALCWSGMPRTALSWTHGKPPIFPM